MESQAKKRHRRTKAELLRDPEYCKKHGIKLQKAATMQAKKPEKTATTTRKKVEKVASQEPKKRHRGTKAELLQDPEYCKKHGIPTTMEAANSGIEKSAEKKTRRKGKETVKDVELRYLPRIYQAWEKVQGLMNDLDSELNLKKLPNELVHFDFACSAMEQAFERLEREIKDRKDATE